MDTQTTKSKSKSGLILGLSLVMAFFFVLTACSPKDSFNGKGVNIHKTYWRGKSSVNTISHEALATNLPTSDGITAE